MWKKIVLGIILALVLPRVVHLIWWLGYHSHIHKHTPGNCQRLPVIEHGSEDMQQLPNGKVLITSGLHTGKGDNPIFSERKGQIFLFEMFLPGKRPELVEIRGKPDIQLLDPLGISAWVDPESGVVTVFVVNQQYFPDQFSVVEKFTYDTGLNVLHHMETIGKGDPSFRLVNNLVAVSSDQFYFTNSYRHKHYSAELWLQLLWGEVGFYDGEQGHTVVGGLNGPNGINISPDLRQVYVANLMDKSIGLYDRTQDNNLTLRETYTLYAAPDNINIDPANGDLIIGTAPIPWQVLQYLDNPTLPCSSQVLRVKVKDGHVTDVTQIFADDGSLISSSASAVHFKGRYLIGSIHTTACICDTRT